MWRKRSWLPGIRLRVGRIEYMNKFTKWILRRVYNLLKREIHRIAREKELGQDFSHENSDCGFQLLEEIKPEDDK
jgi:hypothetical protein